MFEWQAGNIGGKNMLHFIPKLLIRPKFSPFKPRSQLCQRWRFPVTLRVIIFLKGLFLQTLHTFCIKQIQRLKKAFPRANILLQHVKQLGTFHFPGETSGIGEHITARSFIWCHFWDHIWNSVFGYLTKIAFPSTSRSLFSVAKTSCVVRTRTVVTWNQFSRLITNDTLSLFHFFVLGTYLEIFVLVVSLLNPNRMIIFIKIHQKAAIWVKTL